MNSGYDHESGEVVRYLSLAIVAVAIAMMVTAILVSPRPSLAPAQATIFVRRSLPASMKELAKLNPSSNAPDYALDTVSVAPDDRNVAPPGSVSPIVVRVRAGQRVSVAGWAFDPISRRPSEGVLLEVDGTSLVAADYGIRRADVAAAFGNPALEATGFAATIPPNVLRAGRNQIDLVVLSFDGVAYFKPVDRITVNETP